MFRWLRLPGMSRLWPYILLKRIWHAQTPRWHRGDWDGAKRLAKFSLARASRL